MLNWYGDGINELLRVVLGGAVEILEYLPALSAIGLGQDVYICSLLTADVVPFLFKC